MCQEERWPCITRPERHEYFAGVITRQDLSDHSGGCRGTDDREQRELRPADQVADPRDSLRTQEGVAAQREKVV